VLDSGVPWRAVECRAELRMAWQFLARCGFKSGFFQSASRTHFEDIQTVVECALQSDIECALQSDIESALRSRSAFDNPVIEIVLH
jgi:hypothetical protein